MPVTLFAVCRDFCIPHTEWKERLHELEAVSWNVFFVAFNGKWSFNQSGKSEHWESV